MGILDIFRRGPKNKKQVMTLSGWSAFYSQFGSDIYASDVVQQAIKCIVDEMKKLRPTHIIEKGADPVPAKGSKLQRILDGPNPTMTTAEFVEKVTWLLLLNYNAFIIPTYYVWTDPSSGEERRQYEALYPIQPLTVDFIEDATGRLFVTFGFPNGYTTTIDYKDVIHLKYNFSVSDFMGGDYAGQPDHKAILKTLQLNHDLLQGVAKALKASYAVNGIVKYNTVTDDGTMQKNIQEFQAKLENNESGLLPIDLKTEYTQIEHKGDLVDEKTLEFIDEKILRNWGVPLNILTGDYTKDQYEAFYQKTLEPLIISYSQAFSKTLFTQREKGFGNKIVFYPKALIFLSTSQTLEAINALAPTGAMFENEKRVALGMRPLPELEGKRYMSLNWIDANDASRYQTGENENVEVIDEEKDDI